MQNRQVSPPSNEVDLLCILCLARVFCFEFHFLASKVGFLDGSVDGVYFCLSVAVCGDGSFEDHSYKCEEGVQDAQQHVSGFKVKERGAAKLLSSVHLLVSLRVLGGFACKDCSLVLECLIAEGAFDIWPCFEWAVGSLCCHFPSSGLRSHGL
jgi:hypothetical protein